MGLLQLPMSPRWTRMSYHVHDRPAPKIWTDAYLIAFARAAEMRVVTLDRAKVSMAGEALLLA